MTDDATRRALLSGCAGLAAGLAGCARLTDDDQQADDADGGGDGAGSDAETDEASADDGSVDGESTDGEASDDDEGATGTGDDGSDDADSGGGSDEELDLREANVTDVEIEASDGGEYRFSVTLYHDDDGEDGYANWWQVETREGEQLGRRDLLHSHTTDPFTRSETIAVPEDVDCVVVRGHDQTHEYGGQAMLVSVPAGATEARRQGSEPEDFAGADCP